MQTPPPVSSDPLREALIEIWTLDPAIDSDEGYNEWGEADCFRQAQEIARRATVTTTEPALTDRERDLRDVLLRNGFVECDILACNCGSWHARHGYPERFREFADALEEHGIDMNGKTAISALREVLSSRATEPDRNAARYLWLRDEGSLTWVPFRSQWQMSADKCDQAIDDEMDRAALATRTATKD